VFDIKQNYRCGSSVVLSRYGSLTFWRLPGSGIFVTPALVVDGTRSVGGSLLLWVFGGVIAICGLLVWLQLGLSLPLLPTGDDGALRAVPRSGGEKNYVRRITSGDAKIQLMNANSSSSFIEGNATNRSYSSNPCMASPF
jgi:hypothetical protein